jgi:hypothetical protein
VIPVEGPEIRDDLGASLEQLRAGAGATYILDLERSNRGADLVILVQESGNGCGLSYLMQSPSASFSTYAYGVVRRVCTTSFTHEIGHLLGGQHDRESASSSGVYAYSHGWASPETGTRTTMAVNSACTARGENCTRVPFWSDPSTRYSGHALGDEAANNAQTLQATWGIAAGFRAEVSRLEPVTDLKAVHKGKKVVVRWKQSEGATSYSILRTAGIGESVVVGTKGRAGKRFVDRSVASQRSSYCYQVVASDGIAQAIAEPVCLDR